MVGTNEMNIKQVLTWQCIAVFLIFFFSEAKAGWYEYPTKSAAWSACMQTLADLDASLKGSPYEGHYDNPGYCRVEGTSFWCMMNGHGGVSSPYCGDEQGYMYFYWLVDDTICTDGDVFNPYTKECQDACEVGGEGLKINIGLPYPEGSFYCNEGCIEWASGITFGHTGSFCDPNTFKGDCLEFGDTWLEDHGGICIGTSEKCEEDNKDASGKCLLELCPDGMSRVPKGTPGAIQYGLAYCKRLENECSAGMLNISGECELDNEACPMGQKLGPDGTCKWIAEDPKNNDDSGESNNSDNGAGETGSGGNRFSGGDGCNMPPSCSGDPILCGQSRILWRIDCNTRKNRNISGGACDRPPVCTGDKCDALEFSSLIMQWRSTCALEKLATLDNGGNQDTNWRAEEVAGLQALGSDTGPPVDESSIWHVHENKELKTNLFGAQNVSQCATGFTLLGHDIEMGSDWWDLANMIGWLIVSCTYLWVAIRLGG